MAIVGMNGSGKSTLVKLLARLYDPQMGTISWGTHRLSDLCLDDLRSQMAVVFADFLQYELTVAENITLRDVFDDDSYKLLRQVSSDAGAGFIETFPRGILTYIGRELNKEAQPSKGQWQRIALARALYRCTDFLILDEPVSSLDVEMEARFYSQFWNLTRGKTALIISHRLSTVRSADQIAVMDKGRIVELGDHESLLRQHGLYEDLFERQAQSYRHRARRMRSAILHSSH